MVEKIVELHAVVKGQVQGVGFRATVRQHATQLGLKGTVCNLSDGGVEIYAQGSQEQLKKLVGNLKQDASPASVESISTEYYPPKQSYEHFSIIYSRIS